MFKSGSVLQASKYPKGRIQRGLTAWWPLDAANSDFDITSGQVYPKDIVGNNFGADCKSFGLVSSPPGLPTTAYYDSTNTHSEHLVLNGDPLAATSSQATALTLSIWTNWRSFSPSEGANTGNRLWAFGAEVMICVDDGTASGIGLPAGTIIADDNTSGTDLYSTSNLVRLNEWTHIVVTYVGRACTAIYVNGVSTSTASLGGTFGFSSSANLGNIGCRDASARQVNATLADAMVFDGTALTAAEVQDLYNSYLIPNEELPVLIQASSGVSGTLTATDIQDTAAFAGNLNVFGTLTATDPTDTAAFNGTVLVSGTLAVTENPDIPSFAGLIGNVVSGTLTVTETADIAALTGSLNVFGTFAAVESQDTGAFSGTVLISGTLTATDNPDVANFTGSITSALSGTLSATERQDIALFLSDPIVGGAWRWKEGVAELQKNRQTVVVNQSIAIQKAAAVLSKMGGEARAKSLTAVQRTTIATNAAKARWK